jgi:hypothetical protein
MRPPLVSLTVPTKLPWKSCARPGNVETKSAKIKAK